MHRLRRHITLAVDSGGCPHLILAHGVRGRILLIRLVALPGRPGTAMGSLPATFRALMNEARTRGTWATIRAMKMNKLGSLQYMVGEDEQGNRFFENPRETFGRDRWVEYSDVKNFDSSNISPRWHAWLHKMTDDIVDPAKDPKFVRPVTRNMTGTPAAYVPRAHRNSATGSGPAPSKFESWDPTGGSAKEEEPTKDVLDLK